MRYFFLHIFLLVNFTLRTKISIKEGHLSSIIFKQHVGALLVENKMFTKQNKINYWFYRISGIKYHKQYRGLTRALHYLIIYLRVVCGPPPRQLPLRPLLVVFFLLDLTFIYWQMYRYIKSLWFSNHTSNFGTFWYHIAALCCSLILYKQFMQLKT